MIFLKAFVVESVDDLPILIICLKLLAIVV